MFVSVLCVDDTTSDSFPVFENCGEKNRRNRTEGMFSVTERGERSLGNFLVVRVQIPGTCESRMFDLV